MLQTVMCAAHVPMHLRPCHPTDATCDRCNSSHLDVCFNLSDFELCHGHSHVVQALTQRSDHLAVIAAFTAWSSARAAGGRAAGAEFARQHFLSDQVRLIYVVKLQLMHITHSAWSVLPLTCDAYWLVAACWTYTCLIKHNRHDTCDADHPVLSSVKVFQCSLCCVDDSGARR